MVCKARNRNSPRLVPFSRVLAGLPVHDLRSVLRYESFYTITRFGVKLGYKGEGARMCAHADTSG